MDPIFNLRPTQDAERVIDDLLRILKLRRAKPSITGGEVAAIGDIQAWLEAQKEQVREALAAQLEEVSA